MRRWAPLLVGSAALGLLYCLLPAAPPRKPEIGSQPAAAAGATPRLPSNDPPHSPQGARSLLDRAKEILTSRQVERIQELASELRREARTDPAFLRTLGEIVLDSREPMDLRELAAFVLGSLAIADAQQYLSRALSASSEPAWTRTLILSLGSLKEWPSDDQVFGPTLGPWAVRSRIGLVVTVNVCLEDSAIRSQILSYLSGPAQVEVRDAAIRALARSTKFTEVRRDFLSAIRTEASEDLRGEIGKGLAEWARSENVQSPERQAITGTILEQSARRDAAAVRFGTESSLRVMALSQAEVTALATFLTASEFDQRRWAFSILTDQASRSGLPGREALFGSFEQILTKDSSPKTREYAAAAIAAFPDYARAEPVLIGALSDPAWHVRARAAEGLGKLRSDDSVLGALRRTIAQDENESVRKTAQRSLERLSK